MDQDIAVTTEKSKRIISLDIMRGFFLFVILVNHIEFYPNGFDLLTGRGRLLVSAAEGFFFMSGLLVGMVYRRRIANGMKFVFKKMWRRALQLYIGSIALSLLFTAAAIYLHHPTIKDGLYSVINWPHIFKETALMRYGFGWADWLDRYAILMFLAPFAFYLLTKNRWRLLMAISLIAWAFRGNNFTLSWQIVFMVGMVIGYYWHELSARYASLSDKAAKRIRLSIVWITAITFTLSYLSVYILSLLNQRFASLSEGVQSFVLHWNSINELVWRYAQKWTMGPLRIVLFMIWFAAMFMVIEKYKSQINRLTKNVLLLLGQNSLFVYIAHAFVVFIFKLFISPGHPLLINFLVTAGALASLVLITLVYDRYQKFKKINHDKATKQNTSYIKAVLAKI